MAAGSDERYQRKAHQVMTIAVSTEEAQKAFKTFIQSLKTELPQSAQSDNSTLGDLSAIEVRIAARHKSHEASIKEILDARGLDVEVTADLISKFEKRKAKLINNLTEKGREYSGADAKPVVIEAFRVALDDLVSGKLL